MPVRRGRRNRMRELLETGSLMPAHTTSVAPFTPASAEELRAAGISLLTSASDAMNLLAGMRADEQAARRGSTKLEI